MMNVVARYPLKLSSVAIEKIWGGRELEKYAILPPNVNIGEIWLVSDHEGGSKVLNGAYRDLELHQLCSLCGQSILGKRSIARFGTRFPIIIKLLHSRQALSIQVHPDDAYARAHNEASSGKTEAWFILSTEENASINIGFNRDVSPEIVLDSIEAGNLEDCLLNIQVKPGESYYLPSGRVHSMGGGIVLAEVQQNGPVTYRLYDYKRRDPKTGQLRQLDIDKALAVLDFSRTQSPQTIQIMEKREGAVFTTFVVCPYFCGQLVDVENTFEDFIDEHSFVLYSLIEGSCTITPTEKHPETWLKAGETVLLPAECGRVTISPANGCTFLRYFIPDVLEMKQHFLSLGYSDEELKRLGIKESISP